MSDQALKSPQLGRLFLKKKIVCFGRYAMEVPAEAQVIIGALSIPDDVELLDVGTADYTAHAKQEAARILGGSRTAEVIYSGNGPVQDSWQIRYFEDKYAKQDGALYFTTYVNKGNRTFVLGDAVGRGEDERLVATRQATLARNVELRRPLDVPTVSGFCLNDGFVADDRYARQEIVNAGLYLPSLPDVTLSVSSNKNAYGDYSPDDFARMKRDELPLSARVRQAREAQGSTYPQGVVLREGERTVQHWHGEEYLIRRADGTHDFEWAFVGTPKDVANPSEFSVQMFTKVAHNTVGAADKSSLRDVEAIALWDKLLSSLKFRVQVPGAPESSYYYPYPHVSGQGANP